MEVKLNDLSFSYDKINYKNKDIFKNLNIVFEDGYINGITGPKASGKSSFALILSKVLKYEGKSNEYDFGFVPENPREYFITSTVIGELESAMRLNNYEPRDIEKRVLDCLKIVKLDESILYRKLNTLSSSEEKFVSLASALIFNPSVIIIDNISEGLDEKNKKEVIKILRLLKRNHKKNIIIIDKDIDFLHSFIDRLYVINDKKLIEFRDRYELFKDKKMMRKLKIEEPEIIEFENKVLNKKNVRLGFRSDINDLIKDIFRLHENN